MKKTLLGLTLFLLMLSGASLVSAGSSGQPFSLLWDAIEFLQEQIDDIELLQGEQGEDGEKGDKGDDGADGSDGTNLALRDGNGQYLGIPISASERNDGFIIAFFPDEGVTMSFINSRPADVVLFNQTQMDQIFYLEETCGGTPYTRFSGSPAGSVVYDDNRLFKYIAQPGVSTTTVWVDHARDGLVCDNQVHIGNDIFPLEEIPLPFTLPLAWPLVIVSE